MPGVGEITKADLPNRVLAYPRCVKICICTLQPSGGHRQTARILRRASSPRPQRSFCGDLGRHPERRQRADGQKWQSSVQSLPLDARDNLLAQPRNRMEQSVNIVSRTHSDSGPKSTIGLNRAWTAVHLSHGKKCCDPARHASGQLTYQPPSQVESVVRLATKGRRSWHTLLAHRAC